MLQYGCRNPSDLGIDKIPCVEVRFINCQSQGSIVRCTADGDGGSSREYES